MTKIGDGIYIVAEIGGNFTDYDTAKRLIDDAKEAGVNAVKLQTYKAETLSTSSAIFDMENTGVGSQYEYFKKYEIGEELHKKVFDYARNNGLDIFSTPSHVSDLEILEKFNPDVYKIGADDLTNLPFLREVALKGKVIMLSTGMSLMNEVRDAVDAILEAGNDRIIIMHTVSLYPTAPEYVNLNAIQTLKKEFPNFVIGYSDHTMNEYACIFAAIMGAAVIEKHFTYDKNADGPDHMHSLTKNEMKHMVDVIRLYEKMKGNGIKRPMGDETKNRINNRKSLVYGDSFESGHIIREHDLEIKRPGSGIDPRNYKLFIGKQINRDVTKDELVSWGDVN